MTSSRRNANYVVFEREHIPDGAVVANWRIGQRPQAWVQAEQVNVFRQTRGEVAVEDLDDLLRSLVVNGEISIIQPPTVGLFTVAAAKRYIADLNSCWGSTHEYLACNRLPADHQYGMGAIIAGHRRTMASIVLAQRMTGEEHPDLWLPVQYEHNPSFFSGLRTQYQENAHRQVPLWQDAENIAATVRWGRSNGLTTYEDVAAYLGITADRVSKAVSFHALPETVKHKVKAGSLTQEHAIQLERLGSALGLFRLEEVLDKEQVAPLKLKGLQFKLRVDELRPLLEEHGLYEQWEIDLNDELARLLAKDDKSKFVKSRVDELLVGATLFNMAGADAGKYAEAKRMLATRRHLGAQALNALRVLLAVVDADMQRAAYAIENPETAQLSTLMLTPVIANSPSSRNTWSGIVDSMTAIVSMELPDSEVLSALEELSSALADFVNDAALQILCERRGSELEEISDRLRSLLATDGSATGLGSQLDKTLMMFRDAIRDQRGAELGMF